MLSFFYCFLKSLSYFKKIFIPGFLFSGLVACDSGRLPDIPKGKIKGVNFSHLNLSIHQLNETRVIDITSSVALDLQQSIKNKNHSQIESRCFNSNLEDFFGFSKIENSDKIPIKDILPPKAFAPTSDFQSKLYCDFKINVFNGEQEIALILLDDIHITNIENYNNFQLPLKDLAEDQDSHPFYIQKKDMENLKTFMPVDKGEILTLCENSQKIQSFNKRVYPMNDFFSQELFDEKSFSLCRLVIYQQNPSKTWVSVPFYVQGREPQVTYQYQHNYTAKAGFHDERSENQWRKENMGVLNLFNQSPTEVYLQISNFSTQVSVASVYSYKSSNTNYKSQTLKLNAWWSVDHGLLVKKGDSKTPDIYKLEPGSTMSLSLNTNDGFKCEFHKYIVVDNAFQTLPPLKNGELPAHRTFNCLGFYSLSGVLYHLHRFPSITYNLFSTMDHQKWQLLPLGKLIQRQYDGKFSQWVPNHDVPYYCLKEKLKNFPLESPNKELTKCR